MKNVNTASTSIKNWAIDDRPREKLAEKGAESLSNSELLAILINHGSKEKSAVDLAKEILQLGHNNLNELGKLSLINLQEIKGIGTAKAITIAAALELGKRRQTAEILEKPILNNVKKMANYLQLQLANYTKEVFAVLFLNQANKVNKFEILSTGGLTSAIVDIRIILRIALEENATSIVICHNHPSGNLKPSQADLNITKSIKNAVSLLNIKLLDHIIVSDNNYFSFANEEIL